jgi:hypothetical protein
MPSSDFYSRLSSFSSFPEFTLDRHFARAPDDWFVVITDVKGSTAAIEAGRYREVNTIGAASISVVHGVIGRDFPFVFGGDGVSLLVPPDVIEPVLDGLKRLQCLSREHYEIELRVGRITAGEVHGAGFAIEVARHELKAGRCMAMFRGGGMNEAEKRIKGDDARYCVRAEAAGGLELTGLSCRWQPLPNRRGQIVSLLVSASKGVGDNVYAELLAELDRLFEGGLDEANPVNPSLMRYKSAVECVREEGCQHSSRLTPAFLKQLVEIVAAVLLFKWRLPLMSGDGRYRESLRTHADHRKFDDMLRMILDCSDVQVAAIRAFLDARHAKRELCYGMHISSSALMTCFVQGLQDGQHIHFIDGGDGGYAMAAKQLKQQLCDRPCTSAANGHLRSPSW